MRLLALIWFHSDPKENKMLARKLIVSALIAFSFAPFSLGYSQSTEQRTSIETAVRSLFDAISKKDREAIRRMLTPNSKEADTYFSSLERLFGDYKSFELVKVGPISLESTGNTVRTRAHVELMGIDASSGKSVPVYSSNNRLVTFIWLEGAWKLVSHTSAEGDLAKRLVNAKLPDEKDLLLAQNKELVNKALCFFLTQEGNRLSGQITWKEVLEIYSLVLKIAEGIGDKREIALALNSIGNTEKNRGEKAKARAAFERSLKISEEMDDGESIARVTYNMASVVENEDEMLARALELARKLGNKTFIANALGRIGNRHTMRGEFLKANEVLEEAMVLRKELGNPESISIGLSNLALVNESLGDFETARSYLDESIRLSELGGDNYGLMIDLYNVGNILKEMGDFAGAMSFYQRSLDTGRKVDPDNENAPVLINMASLYLHQGNLEQAETLYRRSLAAFEKTKSNYGIGRALAGLSGVEILRDNFSKALEYGLNAHAIYSAEKDEAIKGSLRRLGEIYSKAGDHEKAKGSLEEALKLSEESGSKSEVFQSVMAVAKLKLLRDDPQGALAEFEKAAKAYKGFEIRSDSWIYFARRGDAYMALGKKDLARSDYSHSIELIEKQRISVAGGESERQQFFSNKLAPYSSLVRLFVNENNSQAAIEYSERMKARTLIDAIRNQRHQRFPVLSDNDVAMEKRMRFEIVSLTSQISKESGANANAQQTLANLESKLVRKRLEYEAFQNRLYALYPDLRLHQGEMKPASLADAAALITGSNEALAEYVSAGEYTFLFLITKDAANQPKLQVYKLDVDQRGLGKRVDSHHSRTASGDLDFQRSSRELYELLLKPAEKELAGKTNIVIVPDGPLWDLPFQALMDANGKYLVEKAAVSYAPSLTALREMRKKAKARKPSPEAELLAFGNPIVANETKTRVQRVFMSEKLEPIPEAQRLVKELGKMYGPTRSKIFTGANAREETAKTEAPKYRIVQFATHGVLNNISPMYSHLVFAQDNEKPSEEDGLLEAWELKDLDLKADMVILTACETARGKISGGEGIIGMTWASFIAGAPTTVASQWKVESSSTTELMLEFHRQLLSKKKISKAEALRRASLKVMKMAKYGHPSYWAGFVIVGDAS